MHAWSTRRAHAGKALSDSLIASSSLTCQSHAFDTARRRRLTSCPASTTVTCESGSRGRALRPRAPSHRLNAGTLRHVHLHRFIPLDIQEVRPYWYCTVLDENEYALIAQVPRTATPFALPRSFFLAGAPSHSHPMQHVPHPYSDWCFWLS
jgi:hypothetical protein